MTETLREDAGLPPGAVGALRNGNKIEAIKIVRLERNLGLKEAKDLVDDYVRRDPGLKRSLGKPKRRPSADAGYGLRGSSR